MRRIDGPVQPTTAEGVGVGSTLEELQGAYGDALVRPEGLCSQVTVWWLPGETRAMAFWMGDDGRVSSIGVGDPFEVAG